MKHESYSVIPADIYPFSALLFKDEIIVYDPWLVPDPSVLVREFNLVNRDQEPIAQAV